MSKAYSSPKDGKIFKKYWNKIVKDLSSRDNFNEGHLYQLEVLCDMYAEYELLRDILDVTGHVYETKSKNGGLYIMPRPEVALMARVRAEIRSYSRLLGLMPTKDKNVTLADSEKDSWE